MNLEAQKQPSIDVLIKRCSENIHQIYRRTPMSKCNLNKVTQHRYSPVNLRHIFRTPLPKNISEGLLLKAGSINVTIKIYLEL